MKNAVIPGTMTNAHLQVLVPTTCDYDGTDISDGCGGTMLAIRHLPAKTTMNASHLYSG